jgi:hypothetical protein
MANILPSTVPQSSNVKSIPNVNFLNFTYGPRDKSTYWLAGFTPEPQMGEPPESLIRRIYDVHQPRNNKQLLFSNASSPQAYRKTLAHYFDEELTELLVEDFFCETRTHDEHCSKLGFDPIVGGQDDDADIDRTLKIRKVKSSPNSSSYEVAFVNLQTPVKLIYQLRLTPHGWRVSDIIDSSSSLKDTLR